jgi:TPR repeat protein
MRRLALLAASIVLICPASLADYRAAEAALRAGAFETAAPLLAEEARLGNPVAAFNLAKMHEDGALGRPDFQAAATYYRVAAELDTAPRFDGNALGPNAAALIRAAQMHAQFALGRLYETGKGVPEDIDEAMSWYRRAADLGNEQALLKLALLYRDGHRGLLPDPVQASKYLRRAAEQGNIAAMNDLGRAYLKGLGLPPNANEAAKWFVKASALGSREAEYNLGLLYQAGFEGQPDYLRAAEHFQRAAEAGDGPAMLALGDLYAGGLGVPEDQVAAFVWYLLASSDYGIGEAAQKAAFLSQALSQAEMEEAKARYYALRTSSNAPGPGAAEDSAVEPVEAAPIVPSSTVTTPDPPLLAPPEEPARTEAAPLPISTPSAVQANEIEPGQGQPGAKPFEPELLTPAEPDAN